MTTTAFDRTTQAWHEFQRTGYCGESAPSPPILRSWQRCAALGLSPDATVATLARPLSASQQTLLNWVRSAIEDLYQFIDQPGFVVLLADAQGLALDLQGDPRILEQVRSYGLRHGASLAEEHIGTNAVDLALREAQPIQTIGAEHYCTCFHDLVFAAAPLFDVAGQALGSLAIVTRARAAHPHLLALAIAAAQALYNQLRNEQLLAEANKHLAELYATLETINEGLIFVSPQNDIRHVNNLAAQMLGVTARTVAGRPFDEAIEIPTLLRLALRERRELTDQELLWQGNKGALAAMCSLHPIWDHCRRYLGALITLRPTHSVHRLVQRVVGAQAQFTFSDIIGQSQAILPVLHQAHLAANSKACVLLRGEPGVGKTIFAQAIHNASLRADGPFVQVNCAAIPRALLASELFGVEGGDDQSEHRSRPGKMELAQGGVLFLREVGALSLDLQTNLLRAIEMKHIIRVGGHRVVPIDVRIMTTDGPDLERQIAEGRFRADLAARLSAFSITIPPLRERGDDLLLLVNHLLMIVSERMGRHVVLAPDALQAMGAYPWSGNVRELEVTLERMIQSTEKNVLTLNDLPQPIALVAGSIALPDQPRLIDSQSLAECEAIVRAGRRAAGHLGRTASLLGISRATLWRKMRAYGLTKEHFWQESPGTTLSYE